MIQGALRWLAPMEAILGGAVTKRHEALVTLATIGKAERWRIDFVCSILIASSQSLVSGDLFVIRGLSQGRAGPGIGLAKLLLDKMVQTGSRRDTQMTPGF